MNSELKAIHEADSLADLKRVLAKLDADKLRPGLHAEYDRLFAYKNIKQWNELVRVCEALAFIGWGEREPNEAWAERWLNGGWYTYISSQKMERVTGHGNTRDGGAWAKKGDSFILRDGEDDRDYGIKKPASQRNPLPKNPLRIRRTIANHQKSAKAFVDAITELDKRLNAEMRPGAYGDDFGYVGVSCVFSEHDGLKFVRHEYFHDEADVPEGFTEKYFVRPRLELGRLAKKDGELRWVVTRYFTRKEGEMKLPDIKRVFAEDLHTIMDELQEKLKKKKLKFNVDAMRKDVNKILATW